MAAWIWCDCYLFLGAHLFDAGIEKVVRSCATMLPLLELFQISCKGSGCCRCGGVLHRDVLHVLHGDASIVDAVASSGSAQMQVPTTPVWLVIALTFPCCSKQRMIQKFREPLELCGCTCSPGASATVGAFDHSSREVFHCCCGKDRTNINLNGLAAVNGDKLAFLAASTGTDGQ